MYGGCDAAVHQELLGRANVAVRDGPAQVARVHVLAQPEVVARFVHLDLLVLLERRCRHQQEGTQAGVNWT